MDARASLALRRCRQRSVTAAALAEQLDRSTAEVVAAVEDLARAGFVVERHPHQGFRLLETPAPLCAEELACDLETSRVGRCVRCVGAATSTNDLAWEVADRHGDADGLAVFAEYQTAGRGRRGTRWLAPAHTSILCSVLLWEPNASAHAATLTRAAAVAVAEAIEDESSAQVGIKWPNDLVVDDLKVAGILVEARPSAEDVGGVVVGAGINCTQPPQAFPAGIQPFVASLAMLGELVDRTLLARSLLRRLDRAVVRMGEPGGPEGLRKEAADRCRTLGHRITVSEGEQTFTGEVVDLDPDYGLVLRLSEGGLRRFPAMTTHVVSRGR